MTTRNSAAGGEIPRVGALSLTDVTDCGLQGHLRNIVTTSKVATRVWLDRVPVLAAAQDFVRRGIAPGRTHANRRYLSECVSYNADVTAEEQLVHCDAQTSGGLPAAVAFEIATDGQ
jgi:selenide,water dikinase